MLMQSNNLASRGIDLCLFLVLLGRRLAGFLHPTLASCTNTTQRASTYQLVEVPAAHAHLVLALVLIQAAGERFGAVVAPARVPGAVAGVHALLARRCEGRVLRFGSLGGAAAEHAANHVPDGGAEGHATKMSRSGQRLRLPRQQDFASRKMSRWKLDEGRRAYPAVAAIWPKRPEPEPCFCCCWAPA